MKNLFLFFFIISSCTVFAQQVTITGNASTFKDGDTLKLYKSHPSRLMADVPLLALVKNGSFKFLLNQFGTEVYNLSYHQHNTEFFLGNGDIEIDLADTALKKVNLKGNAAVNNDYNTFSKSIYTDKNYMGFMRARKDLLFSNIKDTVVLNKMKVRVDSLLELSKQDQVSITLAWVREYPNSQINCYILYQYTTGIHYTYGLLPSDQLRTVFNNLPDAVKHNSYGQELQYQLNNLVIGSHAADFAEANPQGKMIKLSDFKGKYLLLDFWASWCGPCRLETPNVVAAYKKYKSRNFDILSVSLDVNKADWIAAIKNDGMPWANVCNPNHMTHWDSRVPKLYNVFYVPANFLIDPNGVIIAKNLYGDELQQTLDKLIK